MSSPQSPPHPRVISKESTLIWPLGPLGNVSIQTKSKFVDDGLKVRVPHKRIVSEERSIVFRPSFFKIQYELHSHNRCGRISRTLRSDCVVDFQAPVFDMCRAGDIRGLRDAFYSGSVSLDVVNPLGMGLLHVSVFARLYPPHLKLDSLRRVVSRKTCVLGFCSWVCVLIVQVWLESV